MTNVIEVYIKLLLTFGGCQVLVEVFERSMFADVWSDVFNVCEERVPIVCPLVPDALV